MIWPEKNLHNEANLNDHEFVVDKQL